jgi:hypothetical protein
MKIPTQKEREAVLNKLREAVVFQIAMFQQQSRKASQSSVLRKDLSIDSR